MRFLLFIEGETEQKGLAEFLGKSLEPYFHRDRRVGFKAVKFSGWSHLYDDTPQKAYLNLTGSSAKEIIAVISIIDLYGPTFYPADQSTAKDRRTWGCAHMETRVRQYFAEKGVPELADRYRHFFAVHETEAWFLAQPELFANNQTIRQAVESKKTPETVNFKRPPAKFLDDLYLQNNRKHYNKVTNGARLFDQLTPSVVADKCPRFAEMVETLRTLAEQASVRRS